MARALPVEVTQGTLEGDILPGDITFYRLQSTADAKLRAYIAHGEVLPVTAKSFGSIGVFAIPEMGRFYRHVLIEKNYPHHGANSFRPFRQSALRSIQVHRRRCFRDRLQSAQGRPLSDRILSPDSSESKFLKNKGLSLKTKVQETVLVSRLRRFVHLCPA